MQKPTPTGAKMALDVWSRQHARSLKVVLNYMHAASADVAKETADVITSSFLSQSVVI